MTKDELIKQIKNVKFESKLEELMIELIDGAKQVDQALLDAIASVANVQADYYDNLANVLDEEADMYRELEEKLEVLDLEYEADNAETIKESYQLYVGELNSRLDELKQKLGGSSGQTNVSSMQAEVSGEDFDTQAQPVVVPPVVVSQYDSNPA